jgi:hypothetical protein
VCGVRVARQRPPAADGGAPARRHTATRATHIPRPIRVPLALAAVAAPRPARSIGERALYFAHAQQHTHIAAIIKR